LRPYVGAGLNYTAFYDEETRGALSGSQLTLNESFGLAAWPVGPRGRFVFFGLSYKP